MATERTVTADKSEGHTLPSGVHFSEVSGRINIYAGALFQVRTSERARAFTPDDVSVFRNELKKHSLRIVREWIHEDGTAFVVVDGCSPSAASRTPVGHHGRGDTIRDDKRADTQGQHPDTAARRGWAPPRSGARGTPSVRPDDASIHLRGEF